MAKLLGNERVDPEVLKTVRGRGGTWAVYQNQAMDSSTFGHLQLLKVGADCTYKEPPRCMPDTSAGTGWKYLFMGYLDLETGEVA